MNWLIIVGMMFPTLDFERSNVLIISEIAGKPAIFSSKPECESYVQVNWQAISAFAMQEFYDRRGMVRGIACVTEDTLEKRDSI
tara:strand:- start:202 stop:453 length:252 start_codon:yes stop_codon:yes gene_type:complete